MNIHEHIKKLRTASKLNQSQLAEIIGTSRSNYTHKETGKTALTADEFIKLLTFLKQHVPGDMYAQTVSELFRTDDTPVACVNETPPPYGETEKNAALESKVSKLEQENANLNEQLKSEREMKAYLKKSLDHADRAIRGYETIMKSAGIPLAPEER